MIFEHTQYRSYLKAALADRVVKNPSYSLRAFAKALEMAPSMLSEVLKGTKNLSQERALLIARKLGLTSSETEYFSLLIQFESARNPELKATIQARMNQANPKRETHDLSIDAFKMISDWYHLPILELSRLDGFTLTPESVSERLGITKLEADVAIERLERLELLVRDPQGRLVKDRDFWVVNARIPNQALRHYHRQMLEKAIESLETQTPQEKFVGSETFGIDPGQLPEANKIIDRFLTEMSELSARSKKRSEVYHLGTQFFRLTKPKSKKEKSK